MSKFRVFALLLSILFVCSEVFFVLHLFGLSILSTKLQILLIVTLVLLTLIFFISITFNARGIFSRVLISLVMICFGTMFVFGGYYTMKTSAMLTDVTESSGKVKSTISIIVKKDSTIDGVEDLNNVSIGLLKSIDNYGTQRCKEDLVKKNVTYNEVDFNSIEDEVNALYDDSVDAIIINESYRSNIIDLEKFSAFDDETKVVFQTVFYVDNNNVANAVEDITSHPFIVLISGSDSRGGLDEVARSDVNMLATVNPKTGTVLLTSIPRDYYVSTQCEMQQGCMIGAMDKLTHTGLHGVETTRATIESLLDIDINYTVRVNFSSVINLVDAVGGIEVNVAPGYAVDSFWTNPQYGVSEGINHLNGEEALAYARERYAYSEGDRQRTKNQQEVLMSIFKKVASPSMIVNYPVFMDALSGAFETNISQTEITKLIQYQINNAPNWVFEQYTLDGSGSTEMCAELGNLAYVMIPNQNSVQEAKEQISLVLNGQ